LQAFDTPGKSLGSPVTRIIDHGPQAVQASVGVVHLDGQLVAEEPAYQGGQLRLGLEIVFAVTGDMAEANCPYPTQHAQTLAGRAFADPEERDEVVEGEFLATGKEKAVDFAHRTREREVFSDMDKKLEDLALGGPESGGAGDGFGRGGGHG
jgi:hypothetical protein